MPDPLQRFFLSKLSTEARINWRRRLSSIDLTFVVSAIAVGAGVLLVFMLY